MFVSCLVCVDEGCLSVVRQCAVGESSPEQLTSASQAAAAKYGVRCGNSFRLSPTRIPKTLSPNSGQTLSRREDMMCNFPGNLWFLLLVLLLRLVYGGTAPRRRQLV